MSSSTLTQYATTHPVPTRTQRNSADPGGHSQTHVPALGRILVKCRLSRGGIGARNSGELAFVMPGHDVDGEGTRRALQALQQILRAGNLRFAGRVLDVKRLHHAVVDHHGVALRARAEAAFPEVDREADRLRESRAAVGEKLDLAGRAGVLLPGVHHK